MTLSISHFCGGSSKIFKMLLSVALSAALIACGGSDGPAPATTPPVVVTQPPPTVPPVDVPPPVVATLPTCTAAISASAPLTDITTVQGASTTSPLVSQTVTVRGVVVGEFQNQTKTQLNGFFMQQAVPDANPLTSEGIFVFAPTTTVAKLTQGDYVQVQGAVAEFGAAGSTVTQLSGTVTVSVCGSGVAVKPTPITLPVASDDALERYEGMLVEFNQALAVAETFELGRFGQLVLALNGRQFNPTNGNSSATSVQNKLNRIVLDDGSSASNPSPTPHLSAAGSAGTRRVGDTVQKLTGVFSHGFGAYRVQPTVVPIFTIANPRPVAPPSLAGDIKVSSFNVLNYFTTLTSTSATARGADNAAEFARQQAKIVEAIAGLNADILGLEEIENNDDVATNSLVAALNAKLGAGTYAAVNSGKFGTDVIKVDMLYKPAKVKRIGATVLPTGADLTNYTTASGRPPLAQRFASVANNGSFWFVVNHFKSKGSCPATGDVDQGQGCWNIARTAQANALNSFVTKLQAGGEGDVLVMGDINSYLLEDPPKALEAAGYESLLKRLPASDRYTYVFGGETGALDHAYASSTFKSQVTGVGVWHINADEPTVLDYNTEFKTDDRYAPTPYRASDHDPVLVALTLTADTVTELPILSINLPTVAIAGSPTTVTVTNAVPGGTATLAGLSINWGDATADTTLAAAGAATHTYAAAGTYSVVVTLTNSAAQSVSQSGVISVKPELLPPGPGGAADLFFSEYIEGNSFNKALEIYNPTTQTVSLSSYAVKTYFNGGTTSNASLTLTGTLAPGAVLVLVNNSASATFKIAGSVTTTVATFNGDDAITLEKLGVVIDRFGQVGFDPGTAWTGGTISTVDRTLRRLSSIKSGDNNATAVFDPSVQWVGFPIDTADGLGSHTVDP
jgi:uncharacterized protein